MKQLYVVGVGPGEYRKMTIEAVEALKECEVIAGYTVYVDLLKEHFLDKEYIVTGMKQEKERCRLALEAGCCRKKDGSGVQRRRRSLRYGGHFMELSVAFPEVETRVVAGVTAALRERRF